MANQYATVHECLSCCAAKLRERETQKEAEKSHQMKQCGVASLTWQPVFSVEGGSAAATATARITIRLPTSGPQASHTNKRRCCTHHVALQDSNVVQFWVFGGDGGGT